MNTLATMGRVAADLTPFVGAALDTGEGIRDGNYWKVAGGVTFAAIDFFSFGGGTFIKVGAKLALREGGEWLARQTVKRSVGQGGKVANGAIKTSTQAFNSFSAFK